MTRKKTEQVDFEAALAELTQIVEAMEQGNLSLEQALSHFERGVTLTKLCQTTLQQAEQRVQILMQQNDQAALQPFNVEDDE